MQYKEIKAFEQSNKSEKNIEKFLCAKSLISHRLSEAKCIIHNVSILTLLSLLQGCYQGTMCLMINRTECGNVVSLNTGIITPKKVNGGMPGE